jgi:twitching motility protein PilJ
MKLDSASVSTEIKKTNSIKGGGKVKRGGMLILEKFQSLLPAWLLKAQLFRRFTRPARFRLTLITLGFCLLALAALTWLNSQTSMTESTLTQFAGNALMHSQRIGKAVPNAIQGNSEAFRQLEESRAAMNDYLAVLAQGGMLQDRTIPRPDAEAATMIADIRQHWQKSDEAAGRIMRLEKELTGFRATLQKLNALNPVLLELSEQIATLNAQSGASPREISAAGQLVMLTQRLGKSANEFLTSEGINQDTAFMLGKDANTFHDIVSGFLEGSAVLRMPAASNPDVRIKLMELQGAFAEYQQLVNGILGNLQNFIAAKEAERLMFNDNEPLRKKLQALQKNYQDKEAQGHWALWGMLVTGLLALLCATAVALLLLSESRERAAEAELRHTQAELQRKKALQEEEAARNINQQNQAAILRLMNELQEVSDGNLTIMATVSEDITGAIADSVNYTLEELRSLLSKVTHTAQQVTAASAVAHKISGELLSLAARQSTEIQQTGQAVLQMTAQIHQVSRAATESAEVAQSSVRAAQQGESAVQNAIRGMQDIRAQIQETSKRIKRLGESSLEIGDITELIADITEQTNVLALNAAIQAASAGEAGRGFAIVAEEVQRLAERSGEAARQISTLVQTIQTDAHDAVIAMEKSTQGVVEGARLSDAAGAVLSDIRRISHHLAELIEGISASTTEQTALADGVARNIDSILTVTEHTRQGTQQTAGSIQELSMLADELKRAVSRFRIAN